MLPIQDLCKHAFKNNSGISAYLTPGQSLALGDYGFYISGTFVIRGNIFTDHGLQKENHLKYRLEESNVNNYLMTTPNGKLVEAESYVNVNGALFASVEIQFPKQSGLVVHLRNVRSEMLCMTDFLAETIQKRVLANTWDSEYRVVWQRELAGEARFAMTHTKDGGRISLLGYVEGPFNDYADLSLGLDIARCENIDIDMWISSIPYSPWVNLVRYCNDSELGRGKEGINGCEDLGFETEYLVLDNSESKL